MNKDEFIEKFKDILQTEEDITLNTKLSDLKQWDSLALLTTSAFFNNEFDIILNYEEAKNFKTVNDIAKRAGL